MARICPKEQCEVEFTHGHGGEEMFLSRLTIPTQPSAGFDHSIALAVGTVVGYGEGITARKEADGWTIFEDGRPGLRVASLDPSRVTPLPLPGHSQQAPVVGRTPCGWMLPHEAHGGCHGLLEPVPDGRFSQHGPVTLNHGPIERYDGPPSKTVLGVVGEHQPQREPVLVDGNHFVYPDMPDFVEDEYSARGPGWGIRTCPYCDYETFGGYESTTKDAMWEHFEKCPVLHPTHDLPDPGTFDAALLAAFRAGAVAQAAWAHNVNEGGKVTGGSPTTELAAYREWRTKWSGEWVIE